VNTARLIVGRIVQAAVMFFVVLFGCYGCGAATIPPVRAVCYAAADIRAQERVDTECKLGDTFVPFAECPAHDDIMAELQRNQEACQ
jgi:hypothetical protein